MKISELKANQSGVNLEAEVVDVGESKAFTRFGRVIRVANAKIKDDSGEASLTLWNEEIDQVKEGNKVKITNGFVKEFQGELTVTSGKFGKIEILGEGEAAGTESESAEPDTEAEDESEEASEPEEAEESAEPEVEEE